MVKKAKSQAKPEEQLIKPLVRVQEEYAFRCHDGNIFRDMKELADGLFNMSDEVFAHHVNLDKNDFSNWVKNVLKDEKLANDLATTSIKTQASWWVATRLALLTGKVV
jgi:hypothetical protein